MPKRRIKRTRLPRTDNSFGESKSKSIEQKPPIKHDIDPVPTTDDDDESSKSSASYTIVTRKRLEEQLPVASRTKNSNKSSSKSNRFISLDMVDGKESISVRSAENTKSSRLFKRNDTEPDKKMSMKEEIHETVEEDMNDPELKRMLRKIAYCRVFTNYLFRQYDMLSIDFQLYSNLEDLMLDLKRRVGAYNAIRRSRMQILQGEDSNSTREGSTG